jgi:hypothetical protein
MVTTVNTVMHMDHQNPNLVMLSFCSGPPRSSAQWGRLPKFLLCKSSLSIEDPRSRGLYYKKYPHRAALVTSLSGIGTNYFPNSLTFHFGLRLRVQRRYPGVSWAFLPLRTSITLQTSTGLSTHYPVGDPYLSLDLSSVPDEYLPFPAHHRHVGWGGSLLTIPE